MAYEMWLPMLVCVAIADLVVVVICLAVVTDRQLIEADYRWRFSLKTLLVATAMVAVNTAVIATLFFAFY
jgi:hypothetical protein